MNTEILGVILQWVALVVLCYPLGRYIAKVYREEVPQGSVDGQPLLVLLGHGAALLPELAAAQSRR